MPVARPISQFFLEPSSTYSCQVIAYNDHGPSLAQQAVGTTLPVTSENVDYHNLSDHYYSLLFSCVAVASLLLVVYADGLEFAELTVSAIQSNMLTYERLLNTVEDTRIRGLCTKINVYIYPTQPCILGNSHGITVIFTRKYH